MFYSYYGGIEKDKNIISKIMQSIEVSYAFYFNKKYERIGHLFQNRFFSKEVEDREYLKNIPLTQLERVIGINRKMIERSIKK